MPTTSFLDAESMYVAASSQHQQTAWDFLRFLENLPQQESVATLSGWVPARIDLDYSTLIQQQPAWAAFVSPNYQVPMQTPPSIIEWNEIETKLADHLVPTFLDRSLVDNSAGALERLQQFADETNSILKEHNHYGE
jgi:ABC-type glycerol-3-phosphate transport system substrate-binding protein